MDAAGRDAYEALRSLDRTTLEAADLEALADAAWWAGEPTESISVRQQAYAAFAALGDARTAGRLAARLAVETASAGQVSVAGGWLARAHRHIDDVEECSEAGFVSIVDSAMHRFGGDADGALRLAEKATAIAERSGDRDLLALGIHLEGLAMISAGRIADGLSRLDEAMTSVLAGELSPFYTGLVYCNVIGACLDLAELRRAGEWSTAAREWCETLPPDSPYPRTCRVHRAQLARLAGAWQNAQNEATRATEQAGHPEPWETGLAFYEIGEVHRLRGDLIAAEAAFARAREHGGDPQPGLALLRLARGDARAAATALRLATDEVDSAPRRAWLLAARVEVALAAGEPDEAREATAELAAIAEGFPAPAVEALAAVCVGSLRAAIGEAESGLAPLRRALAIWQEAGVAYEAARVRVQLGAALRSLGAIEDAMLELRAARDAFERLGAAPDAAAARELMGEQPGLPNGLTSREAEVLRLVASGMTNRDVAVELVISEHTVSRHLQNIYAKIEVSTRSAATAFAFAHGLT